MKGGKIFTDLNGKLGQESLKTVSVFPVELKGAEGEESLVLGVSRDNVQGEEGGRGFVEYEDYQEGDADLLPDPGLTVDYEEEGWHGWQEGLGGPGLYLKEATY